MRRLYCCVAVLATLTAQSASAQELAQGPYGAGGTWNIYELGEDFLTWAEALQEAQSRTREGVQGDLASIHSFEENQALSDFTFNQIFWIGATDREGTAPLVEQNGHLSPQESIQLEVEEFLGQENVDGAKLAGWAWTSGEPFCFHNWPSGEPNNWDGTAAGEAEVGFEDATFVRADGMWNDAPGGYAENEPVVPTLQPDTSTEERDDLPNERLYDFVIEYRTNSPTPFPGIEEVGEEPFYEEGCEPPLPGDPCDFDGDGSLGEGDINLLSAAIASGENDARFDVNKDGEVNGGDLSFFVQDESKLHTWFGDANLDSEFNSGDLVAVFSAGKYETEAAATWGEGDWNADLQFNSGDLVAAFADGGYEIGPRMDAAAVVPEPTSLCLLLIGFAAVARLRRRRP